MTILGYILAAALIAGYGWLWVWTAKQAEDPRVGVGPPLGGALTCDKCGYVLHPKNLPAWDSKSILCLTCRRTKGTTMANRKITPDMETKLLAARRAVKAMEVVLVTATERRKEAREELDRVQGALNLLLDQAEKGPGPLLDQANVDTVAEIIVENAE